MAATKQPTIAAVAAGLTALAGRVSTVERSATDHSAALGVVEATLDNLEPLRGQVRSKVGLSTFALALALVALIAVAALMKGGPVGPRGPQGPEGATIIGPPGPAGDTSALKAEIASLRKEIEAVKVTPPPTPAPAPAVGESGSQPTYSSFELDWLADGPNLVLVREVGGRKRGFGPSWAEPGPEVKKPRGWDGAKWLRNSRGDWALGR